MPARRLQPKCRHFFTLFALVLLVPGCVEPQTIDSSVTLNATVSKTVALSIPPNAIDSDVDVDVLSSGNTVRLIVSGNGLGSQVIRVPLLVRSNSDFRISGKFESTTAVL